jgi:hypothetical protein
MRGPQKPRPANDRYTHLAGEVDLNGLNANVLRTRRHCRIRVNSWDGKKGLQLMRTVKSGLKAYNKKLDGRTKTGPNGGVEGEV